MKRNSFNITIVGLSLILGLLSCNNKPKKNDRTDTINSGTIQIVADESFSPIINEEIEVFQSQYKDAKIKPLYTNELDGVNMLMKGKTSMMITSRTFSAKELKNLKDRKFLPRTIAIAYDGLALIVNNSNPDSCISVQNIKDILTGKVTKWNKIFPKSKLGNIEVTFDNKQSSTVHYCVDSLLGGRPINSENIYAVNKSVDVINFVEKHPNAIGIIGSNWLNDKRDTTNVTFKRNIKVLGVSKIHPATSESSWKPYQYYLYNGNYPLIRTIYILLNDPYNLLPTTFAHFMQQPKGQLIIKRSSLLPAYGEMQVINVNVSED